MNSYSLLIILTYFLCDVSLESPTVTWKHQSPIGFNRFNIQVQKNPVTLKFSPAYFHTHQSFFIRKTTFTVQVQMRRDLRSDLYLEGDGMDGPYIFAQLHFHWGSHDDSGSEHTDNGRKFPMEMHLVHYHSKYNNFNEAAASKDPRSLLVIGVWFKIVDKDNPAMEPIVEALQGLPKDLSHVRGKLNVHALLPKQLSVLYRYDGSLTTPPYSEDVYWQMFKNPALISKKQLKAFRKVESDDGRNLSDNNRYPFPTGQGRGVTEYTNVRILHGPSHPVVHVQVPVVTPIQQLPHGRFGFGRVVMKASATAPNSNAVL